MRIGTKSVLFGVHCVFVHPLFVALAWRRLYGMPWDPRLWVAFAVHDLGYFGKPNMDGPEGERHVETGAAIMLRLFGPAWGDFVRYHSRFYARLHNRPVSKLCVADKLALCYTWDWLYLLLANLSGEIHEYMQRADRGEKYASMSVSTADQRQWLADVKAYCRRWVDEHRGGRTDTWTPAASEASR